VYLSNQSLLVIIVVGIVAGWLAGKVMEGGGFGLIGDLVVGLIGAWRLAAAATWHSLWCGDHCPDCKCSYRSGRTSAYPSTGWR